MKKPLTIMISSRCKDMIYFKNEAIQLTSLRNKIKEMINKETLFSENLLTTWINETAEPANANEDAWEHCLRQAREADLFICLYNGNSGWCRSGNTGFGICHAELEAALASGRSKVQLIELPRPLDGADEPKDQSFQNYVKKLNLFRGGEVTCENQLYTRVGEAITGALVNLSRRGKNSSAKDKYDRGDALNWTRMSFEQRKSEIETVILSALSEKNRLHEPPLYTIIPINNMDVIFRVSAVPGPMSVAEAREMVGRPHLSDHQVATEFPKSKVIGPVHVVGCHKGITESQALSVLGIPDAVLVKSGFGIYVADNIQKAQIVFLNNCRDPATTRHSTQLFFDWLENSGEADPLCQRAKSRRKIINSISRELSNQDKTR